MPDAGVWVLFAMIGLFLGCALALAFADDEWRIEKPQDDLTDRLIHRERRP